MLNQNKKVFFSVIVAVIIIAFLLNKFKFNQGSNQSDYETSQTTTDSLLPDGILYDGSGNIEIEQVSIEPARRPVLAVPSLDRPLVFPVEMSAEAKKIIGDRINQNVASLKKDSSLFDNWLALGINRKSINDYEGAKEAWLYAAYLNPGNPVPFTDLGDLYGYYLKNPVEAEKNFQKAIDIDPSNINWYIRLADFYREVFDDLIKAKATLEKGLVKVPDNENLIKSLNLVNELIEARSQQ